MHGRESDTQIESPLGGYRSIMREVIALRDEVHRLRAVVAAVLVGHIVMIALLVGVVWAGR